MDDVQRALEKAAEAMNTYHHTDEDGTPPVDRVMREAARAAVLAFLKAIPVKIIGESERITITREWSVREMIAAIRARGDG